MEVSIALTTVIAVCATLTALGLIFRILLNPVYTEITYLKKDVAGLQGDVAGLKDDVTELKNGQKALEDGQKSLENGQKEFNKKLDHLINRLSDKGAI